MDEGLLNDLLECSVCLERLDTSSRVLPCQHTFCLKCLKVIVESHKELRCPECRILVETKVEELPPNVLLMRILEGMKNSTVPKKSTISGRSRSGHAQVLTGQPRGELKQLPPHARAMYDYVSQELGDLSFKKGETILLQKKLDPFWYHGECSGRSGTFPITFVQVVVPLPIPTALCKALYDFRMSAPDEEGCLAFDKGAIITVHRRVDENWAEGRLEQRLGIFPIAFVELNQAARQLMNCVPLNRSVPPLPEHSRAGHSEHRLHASQHPHRYQQMSISTPTAQGSYQSSGNMSQSHPNYQTHVQQMPQPQILLPQTGNHSITTITHGGLVTTALPRNILEPTQAKQSLDLIHFTNMHNKHQPTISLQSVSRINENFDRLRSVKYDNYSTETTYQNVRNDHVPVSIAMFNASSDSSSSVNTPSGAVSSTTTPNTSSDTSTCESADPSLPSSPDNNTERTTQNPEDEDPTRDVNTSMGVLNLNESSTATNTSLNVSLPPAESPKLNAPSGSNSLQLQGESEESASNNEPCSLPTSSKNVRSGPDSLLNFGLGLQAALSPAHSKEGSYVSSRTHREHRERDKRHSLTPSTHLQANHSAQNRHSAEIVATSLLDHTPERDRDRERPERERERRRRRSRSNERPLPATYVALYPYKPQKSDELELKKGVTYTVTERCRDGWFKGWSERGARAGVFPGNYVAPAPAPLSAPARSRHDKTGSGGKGSATAGVAAAPDAPPREPSPTLQPVSPATYPWNTQSHQGTPRSDKCKEKSKAEKSISSGVNLMKRLAAMRKCRSPPPAGYSMDNPVFEDAPSTSLMNVPEHPVHVRASNESPWQSQHRKSQSLDVSASRRERHHGQAIKERFRCIVPYPPNSEYELELKVDDIVLVCKKRGDGWYRGTLQRTGRTGLFPASFVQSCPE